MKKEGVLVLVRLLFSGSICLSVLNLHPTGTSIRFILPIPTHFQSSFSRFRGLVSDINVLLFSSFPSKGGRNFLSLLLTAARSYLTSPPSSIIDSVFK